MSIRQSVLSALWLIFGLLAASASAQPSVRPRDVNALPSSATDYLRVLAKTQPLDLSRVAITGHSAGGHAALWITARSKLAKSTEIRGNDPLPVHAAIAIDGPGDIASFIGLDAKICGKPVIEPLMGGSPAAHAGRYAQGSPSVLWPLGVPQYLIAARVLLPDDAGNYQAQSKAAGDRVELQVPTPAGHFDIIAPGSATWPTVEAFIVKVVMGLKAGR